MIVSPRNIVWTARVVVAILGMIATGDRAVAQPVSSLGEDANLEWLIPNESLKKPLADQVPIVFVSRGQNRKEWESLPKYWNEGTEEVVVPVTKKPIVRKVIKIKLPLGLNLAPPVPAENPMTLNKWELGKRLYFDHVLSSSGSVACASCHDPGRGFTDHAQFSTGIGGAKGGMNAPTVLNSAYNRQQFWDGRAASLEDQAQGPVQNSLEMFSGKGHAWNDATRRVRNKEGYKSKFEQEFGHAATRDAIAKAIATYERTILVGNSINDRAEIAMRKRVEEDEGTNFTVKDVDYEKVLKDAFKAKDTPALEALSLDSTKDEEKIPAVAKSINQGRVLFFGKARCNACHVGESFTDLGYHNLGVGAKDGKLPPDQLGRFGSLGVGQKDPSLVGAFKTPPLRGLLVTKPYMHDGSEKTLEEVVEFYDKGGNANEFLDGKMRDYDSEQAYMKAKAGKEPWTGPEVTVFTRGGQPVIPLKLKLTPQEKKDLVMFLRSLESDPVDATVADPTWFPK